MAEVTMRDVVRRLHGENSEAVLELLEFDYSLDEFLRILENLTVASQELHAAVREVATDDENFARVDTAVERAGRLNATATQILGAFRMLRDAVKSWNIAEARRPSSNPSGPGSSLRG
jgi:hypothetical protein